jgi:hypothetical protein
MPLHSLGFRKALHTNFVSRLIFLPCIFSGAIFAESDLVFFLFKGCFSCFSSLTPPNGAVLLPDIFALFLEMANHFNGSKAICTTHGLANSSQSSNAEVSSFDVLSFSFFSFSALILSILRISISILFKSLFQTNWCNSPFSVGSRFMNVILTLVWGIARWSLVRKKSNADQSIPSGLGRGPKVPTPHSFGQMVLWVLWIILNN